VWSFSPPEDELLDDYGSASPMSMPDHNPAEYQDAHSMPNLQTPSRLSQVVHDHDRPEDVAMEDAPTMDEAPELPVAGHQLVGKPWSSALP
jgi:hypothetical protein